MPVNRFARLQGSLVDMPVTQGQINQGAALGGAAGSATLVAILGPAAAAGPIGIAIGGAVIAIQALSGKISHLINGCGDACVQATAIVNEAETYVEQISAAYWQAPTRTKSFQTWTLQQLDAIFAQVVTLCGKIPGDPGRKCVQERLTRGFQAPWCTAANLPIGPQCGGWYDVTYDPIMHDPAVQPDPTATDVLTNGVNQVVAALPGGYATAVVIGLAVFGFVAYKVRT